MRKFKWHVVSRICRRETRGRNPDFSSLSFASPEQAVLLSRDGRAYAILDQESVAPRSQVWVVSLAGEDTGIKNILQALVAQAGERTDSVLVDSPDEKLAQVRLDELGFRPAAPDGNYVIVERRLEP